MKRNLNQAVRNSSRHGAAMQSKIQKGGGKVRPPSISPHIALFLEADGGISEEIIDLTTAEYAALKRAAAPSDDGILLYMSNAALEKINCPLPTQYLPTTAADTPSCLCLFDAGVGELAGEIPLVERELPSVVIAAYRQRVTLDQFIADAIREKLRAAPGKHAALLEHKSAPGAQAARPADQRRAA